MKYHYTKNPYVLANAKTYDAGFFADLAFRASVESAAKTQGRATKP